jgi:hypothetical protein
MSLPVSIITPSLARDYESCRLLCDTVDRYVTGGFTHFIVISATDRPLFAHLEGPNRRLVDEATLLPRSLISLPVRWKNRRYRWHVQQLLKFSMAISQPNQRVMFVDSDNFFVRPFDLAAFAGGATIPLQLDPGAVDGRDADHVTWLENAHRVLGLPAPELPANDFIGQMIVWDAAIVREILARIETHTGTAWWKALGRLRHFSEYMIYGAAVAANPAWRARHHIVTEPPCLSYWNGPALDAAALQRFAADLRPHQSALGIQSFTRTPVDLLRALALPAKVAA